MSSDLHRVADAIRYLAQHWQEAPELESFAGRYGLSPSHFQRMFARLTGLSPKQFAQQLALGDAQRRLRMGESVLDSALDAGLSGPSRLHDLCVEIEAVTPGEYKSGGAGVILRWGMHPTLFGPTLLAATERGLSALFFVDENQASIEEGLRDLQARWPAAELVEDSEATASFAQLIFSEKASPEKALRLWVRGTNFQLQVWRALMQVSPGRLTSYGRLAASVGSPGAARAVGTAVGANPISLIIPCHRVLRETGAIGGYHWGLDRKRSILAWEHGQIG